MLPTPRPSDEYERQVREVRRTNIRIGLVALPFLVLAFVATVQLNAMFDARLQTQLYRPACESVCAPLGGLRSEPWRGARGRSYEVFCPCRNGGDARNADLSGGPLLDRALHRGLKGVILFGTAVGVGLVGFALGIAFSRLLKR